MNIQLVICLCIHQMNIWSVIHRIPAHTNWIFSWQSAWPIHTLNEYSVGKSTGPLHTPNEYSVSNPPDPCIHQLNIRSVIRLNPVYTEWIFSRKSAGPPHTPNEYSVSNPPDPCIHQMNIWSVIRRTPAYTKWIFGQQSAGSLHTPNEYSVTNPPDPYVRQMNIQSDIHPIYLHSLFVILISAKPVCYVNWIFSG